MISFLDHAKRKEGKEFILCPLQLFNRKEVYHKCTLKLSAKYILSPGLTL